MKKEFKSYRFETSTTMEQLEMNSNSYGAVLKYGNKVIFAAMNYKGEILAAIYEGKHGGDRMAFPSERLQTGGDGRVVRRPENLLHGWRTGV
ncbi:MAG: hypothetical protein LUE89_09285 [Clostridiales bacterium]|nr:hypothetical protein [Clostridiales bacterium]